MEEAVGSIAEGVGRRGLRSDASIRTDVCSVEKSGIMRRSRNQIE